MNTLIKGITASIAVTLVTVGPASADFNTTADSLLNVDRFGSDYSVPEPAADNTVGSTAFSNIVSTDKNIYQNRSRERAAEVLLSVDDVKNYLAITR